MSIKSCFTVTRFHWSLSFILENWGDHSKIAQFAYGHYYVFWTFEYYNDDWYGEMMQTKTVPCNIWVRHFDYYCVRETFICSVKFRFKVVVTFYLLRCENHHADSKKNQSQPMFFKFIIMEFPCHEYYSWPQYKYTYSYNSQPNSFCYQKSIIVMIKNIKAYLRIELTILSEEWKLNYQTKCSNDSWSYDQYPGRYENAWFNQSVFLIWFGNLLCVIEELSNRFLMFSCDNEDQSYPLIQYRKMYKWSKQRSHLLGYRHQNNNSKLEIVSWSKFGRLLIIWYLTFVCPWLSLQQYYMQSIKDMPAYVLIYYKLI